MRCFIGLGTNLGDRRANLESAARALREGASLLRVSPVYTTPALLPPGAPAEWDIPYLNAVAEIDWSGSAVELLAFLKATEIALGRSPSDRWAPRVIDLDILTFGAQVVEAPGLRVPHPGMLTRSFVLDPLKDLAPALVLPHCAEAVCALARSLPGHTPLIMGILNLTPDSFSERGELLNSETLVSRVTTLLAARVQILDLGAESTRPGATPVSVDEEWARLEPALEKVKSLSGSRLLAPVISVDTTKPEIAERALRRGAHWINDVAGLSNPRMVEVAREHRCPAIFMHHVTVPADPKRVLSPDCDPIAEVKRWALTRIETLVAAGLDIEQLIFDPGIGFGKTAHQSLAILKRAAELADLPVRTVIGHSRKSFMRTWGFDDVSARDMATLGASLALTSRGVDILRVHDGAAHTQALRAWAELRPVNC